MTTHLGDGPAPAAKAVSPYSLFMLILSTGVLLILAIELLIPLPIEVRAVLAIMDNVVAVLFLLDFVLCFVRAPDKPSYFVRWGWIDLLSSIPTVDALRWGRGARLIRLVRLARGLRASRDLGRLMLTHRAQSALCAAVLLVLLCLTSGSIAVLLVEADTEGGIHTANDALWWACATLATVGYGDVVPVTIEGRLIGVGLMVAGLVLLGTLSGLFASWFLTGHPDRSPPPRP